MRIGKESIRQHVSVDDAARKTYKPRKINSVLVKEQMNNNPDATLKELASFFGYWPQSVYKRCIKLCITYKEKHSTQQEIKKSVKHFWPKSYSCI